ncbi:unnamed protein product [Rotaria magnacalcarata]|uniref:Uncharacterized protein n=1 Tax=Rotaria magnacalcarata TaxID=392030 RepID=A0A8S2W6E3_9BILA|nr:unnamed protein product [Rotaria magnacalcarata]
MHHPSYSSRFVMIKNETATTMSESHSSLSISNDKKPTMEEIDALPKHPVQFTAEYLLTYLVPIIQKMIDSEVVSISSTSCA